MSHILFAYHIPLKGKVRALTETEREPNGPRAKTGYNWIHFTSLDSQTAPWMEADTQLDHIAEETLLAADSRPRTLLHEKALLINLRGVNLNEGSAPEDMVGIRFFVEKNRIISVERRSLMATEDIAKRITQQAAPETTGGFIALFGLALADRMNPRDALNTLSLQSFDFINESDRLKIREAADQATRINEELDAIRERCAIVKDQLVDQRSEEMNRNMMVLSVVAAVFLPLGLISGMFGINVGGMPWTETGLGFWYVTAIIIAIAAALLAVFKWAKWL